MYFLGKVPSTDTTWMCSTICLSSYHVTLVHYGSHRKGEGCWQLVTGLMPPDSTQAVDPFVHAKYS